jgi:chromosomal replication initiator protein
MKAEQYWEAALGQLQLEMPRASFDTWVRDSELLAYEDGAFIIGVQNGYARDWLHERLSGKVQQLLTGIVGRSVEVRFVVWQGEVEGSEARSAVQTPVEIRQPESLRLNPRYGFDEFVVGPSNRLAHAAALAVMENPARAYNPLFLYGGVGLGKTHLLHAIGLACQQKGLNVRYVSSEEFTNDLIHAIRKQTTQSFRDFYRSTDVLLIDDIQFIAGKESTQEEFFHTFNTLHGQDKQIILTSDRPPKAMNTLEERLRSRFEWGLTADIQPPDFETRLAILRNKAERSRFRVEFSVLEVIAKRVKSNIRELEGALNRVLAMSDLSGVPVSDTMVETVLSDLLPMRIEVSADRIISAISEYYSITEERMLSKERSREVALPRQVAMYLMREEVGSSLPRIGESLGGRDHTTVLYGCEKIADLLETDDRLRQQVGSIMERLQEPTQTPA